MKTTEINTNNPIHWLAITEAATAPIKSVLYFDEWCNVRQSGGTNLISCTMGTDQNGIKWKSSISLRDIVLVQPDAIRDIICEANTCENLKQYINEA